MHITNRPVITLLVAVILLAAPMLGTAGRVLPPAQAAAPVVPQLRPDATDRIDTYFSAQAHAHNFTGTVLLAQGNTILLSKGYGWADAGRKIYNSGGTRFAVGFTANVELATEALLQLEQAGKLRESDLLCNYIARCPTAWSAVTVHELLNFTSGIDEEGDSGHSLTLPEVLQQMEQLPLTYAPGAGCCTFGPTAPVEEYLVERLSGQSFGTYLQRYIFAPSGLAGTGFYLHLPPSDPPLAIGYEGWQMPAAPYDVSSEGGAIYSTATDFFRWQYGLLTGHILSPSSVAKLITPTFTACPPGCGSGVKLVAMTDGFTLSTDAVDGLDLDDLGNAGFDPNGFGNWVDYWPATKVTYLAFTNTEHNQWLRSVPVESLLYR